MSAPAKPAAAPAKKQSSFLADFALGGVSGAVAKTCTAPIERVKLLIQTQDANPRIRSGEIARYTGIGNCFTRVYQEQGFAAFWRGNFTNVIRYFPTQAFNFAFKDTIKAMFPKTNPKEEFGKFFLINMASGGLAGAGSLAIVYPLDYARTRLASDVGTGKRDFAGLGDCLRKTASGPKGVLGLYNGFAQGCEIYEVDMGAPGGTPTNPSSLLHSGDPLVAGHCKDELWGLDTAPSDSPDLFVTAGDDATVRVWSMSEKRMLVCSRVSERARAVAWDPAPGGGGLLAVGLGGDVGKERANRPRPKTGYIVALKYESSEAGELLSAIPGSEQPARDDKLKPQRPLEFISAIKFSSDGQSLAVGSHDNNIYLYNVNPAAGGVSPPFSHRATFNKAHSFITHLDFGTTGSGESTSVLQCTTGDYELLFCSGADGKHITSAAAVRDAEWSSSTCTLGWGVQGIWPKGADGTDVNACHVSKGLVATVDDFGKLSVFRYPCIGARAEAVVGLGHSSHVTNVKFSHDQSRVLTTGGNDGCILQWAVIKT